MKALVAATAFIILSISQAFAQVPSISAGAPSVVPIAPVKVKHTFKYNARFICVNPSPFLANGTYTTDISVHNPQDDEVSIQKKGVATEIEGVPLGQVGQSFTVILPVDTGIHIDCADIALNLLPNAAILTGYVVITSPKELDVTAAYTSVFVTTPPS